MENRYQAANGMKTTVVNAMQRFVAGSCLFLTALLAVVLAGCSGFVATNRPESGVGLLSASLRQPIELAVETHGGIRPGDTVIIRLAAVDPNTTDALRLSIDGAGTGWQLQDRLAGGELRFEWTASEPAIYEIVGQARTLDGAIHESRMALLVLLPDGGTTHGQPAPRFPPEDEDESTQEATEPSSQELPAIWETTVALPTYPYWDYQTEQIDAEYLWPYRRFDAEAYAADAPQAQARTYRLVILENTYLRLSILPELGGRIWQVEHKSTGHTMFYQNPVVKPSPWGPPQQLGWLALGGIEWAAPVDEHGYDWGTSWRVDTFAEEDGALRAVISMPDDERLLWGEIEVTLPPHAAYFEVSPRLENRSESQLDFDFWLNAMLAPGPHNRPSAGTRFAIPGRLVQVHSRGDGELPQATEPLRWPFYGAHDLSRLDSYNHYLGFFEYPQAQGPFIAVYDTVVDAGVARVFPADIARGSKVFSLGWDDPIPSRYYTDGRSAYVELHGGPARSFFEQAALSPGGELTWRERWYPIHGLGDLVYADAWGALNVTESARGLAIDVYPVADTTGEIRVLRGSQVVAAQPFEGGPDAPARVVLAEINNSADITEIRIVGIVATHPTVTVADASGSDHGQERVLLSYYPGQR
jgi:hypothetical protein